MAGQTSQEPTGIRRRRFGLVCIASLLGCAILPAVTWAQTPGFVGKWLLQMDMGRNPSYGILEIERSGSGLDAYIDGGPIHLLDVDGDHIRFDLDWTDGGDRLRFYILDGELAGGKLSGSFTEEDKPIGTWSATPWMEHPDAGKAPAPVDFSGIWAVLSRGTHKDAFALTPQARAINDAYDPTLDDPHLRCVSGGVIRMEDGPFPHQIIVLDDEIIILYEYFHQVRHIWMDGRDFPEDIEYAYLDMGYSIGHWEGATLVVETRGMKPTVWDAGGMPVSPAAVITERKYLDEDGNLHADYTLVDPDYYERPVYRHAYWGRGQAAEISENACDPHSFYRSLDLEGRLEGYWGRSENRL